MAAAKMKFITRMPDNVKEARALIENGVGENGKNVVYRNAHNQDVGYVVEESTVDYKGYALKCAIVYSTALEPAKVKSIEKKAAVFLTAIPSSLTTPFRPALIPELACIN